MGRRLEGCVWGTFQVEEAAFVGTGSVSTAPLLQWAGWLLGQAGMGRAQGGAAGMSPVMWALWAEPKALDLTPRQLRPWCVV